jgi:hypothetical protein
MTRWRTVHNRRRSKARSWWQRFGDRRHYPTPLTIEKVRAVVRLLDRLDERRPTYSALDSES